MASATLLFLGSTGAADQDTPPAVQRTRVSGAIHFPDRGRWALQTESDRFEANFMTQEFGSTDHELVAVPGGGYFREGLGAALETLPWEFTMVPDADGLSSVGTTFVDQVGVLPFGFPGFEPDGLRTLIGALSDPEHPGPMAGGAPAVAPDRAGRMDAHECGIR